MPYGNGMHNPVVAALWRFRSNPRPPLQVANGTRTDTMPGPQVESESFADDLNAAWLPTRQGQAVPMQGERVYDVEPDWDE